MQKLKIIILIILNYNYTSCLKFNFRTRFSDHWSWQDKHLWWREWRTFPGLFRLFRPSGFATNMAAEFVCAIVQETLERLHSCQDDDFSRILLRMEYWNRTIISCGKLPDSIEADIVSAISCLSSKQESSFATYMANPSKCIGGLDSEFTRPK